MSGSSDGSARLAAETGATMGVLRIQNYEAAHHSINTYKEHARKHGWEPKPENVMLAMNCCVAPTREEAMDTLSRGYDYFFGVLGGGIRTVDAAAAAVAAGADMVVTGTLVERSSMVKEELQPIIGAVHAG